MASTRIRKRRDGSIYYAVLFREDGAQRSWSYNDPAEANYVKKLLDQVGPEQTRRILAIESATGPTVLTVEQWLTHHIDTLTGIEAATRARYRRYVARDISGAFGAIPLTLLTRAEIAAWLNALEGASKTRVNKLRFLSGALNAAVSAGEIPANPAKGLRPPSGLRREIVFLTPAEFRLIRDNMTPRWRPLATWLISTGTRFGEATALRVGDIDPDNNTARITRAWKYSSDGTEQIGPPKSRAGIRTIDVPASTIKMLELERDAAELLFPTESGGKVSAQLFYDKAWKPALDKATKEDAEPRLMKRPRVHDARHSCASWMLNAGIPITVVSRHLGHASIKTTVDTYGHLDRAVSKRAAQAVGDALDVTL